MADNYLKSVSIKGSINVTDIVEHRTVKITICNCNLQLRSKCVLLCPVTEARNFDTHSVQQNAQLVRPDMTIFFPRAPAKSLRLINQIFSAMYQSIIMQFCTRGHKNLCIKNRLTIMKLSALASIWRKQSVMKLITIGMLQIRVQGALLCK